MHITSYASIRYVIKRKVSSFVFVFQFKAAENKNYIEAQEAEQRKLLKIISEADAERLRQKKELDQVISERDILGTQLVRRNDELALLYEKIKIQQSRLNKGEIQYRYVFQWMERWMTGERGRK